MRRLRFTAATASAVALSVVCLPRVASADDAEPVVERHPPSSIRIPLVLGGLGVAGGAYGLGMLVAQTTPDVPGSGALAIPVVGPWIALGQNACAPDNPDCGAIKAFRGVMLAFEGVVQIAGLALVGEGIFLKTEAGRAKATGLLEYRRGDFTIRPDPMTTKTSAGLGVSGTF